MIVVSTSDRAALDAALWRIWLPPAGAIESVAAILSSVRTGGDAALVEYARKFDDETFDAGRLRVPVPPAAEARSALPPDVADALDVARDRIARFHDRQRQADFSYAEEDGTRYGFYRHALDSVAAYVPGGNAPLPVAALMSVVPAKLAGVNRAIVLTPPQRNGRIHPSVLYACAIAGVDELYAVGGAHAIAAAAFGTETIAPVEKIVGCGGLWTNEAKRQVFGYCGIDSLAGPAEVLVVADDGANSEFVAGELLAQAEYAGAGRLAVVSESRPLLDAVAQLIDTLDVKTLERGQLISDALERDGYLIHALGREDVFSVIERFAPGYLCLQVRDASSYLPRIRRAGAVFVGDMTPLACGDYAAGINHIVPTAGTARFASALSLADFTRSFTIVENSLERMMNDALAVASLAEMDGLPQHAQTARMRYGG
jgi:histidinol dehydrogenase